MLEVLAANRISNNPISRSTASMELWLQFTIVYARVVFYKCPVYSETVLRVYKH